MTADSVYQHVREHLAYLRLPAIADRLAPALESAARDSTDYTTFLAELLKAEVDAVEQRRLQDGAGVRMVSDEPPSVEQQQSDHGRTRD